ncbi:hypothetical protein F8M41_012817 [Gigaspora margarita]|uniref:Uncharacterized protein n=1 Tax=Gigaspora margarita TaxID=4874 RepID=A0A8H4AT18_GIGMA|nr:hypothetical protein F8M41_012817 [Gigaspora margarita]
MEAGLTLNSSKRCVVKICKGSSTGKWKKITDNVLIKAEANGTLASYYRDHKDEYICIGCYNAIVVNAASSFKEHALNWDNGLKRRRNSFSISESILLLTNFIFKREVLDGEPPVFSFSQLRSIAINKNNDLSFFFDQIEDIACLGKKTEAEKRELERSLAYQCYLMCWNQSRVIPLWNLHESEMGGDYFSWVDGVNVLSKFLYDREKVEQKPAIYSFKQLHKEMVAKDIRLSSFFNSIYNATLLDKKSDNYSTNDVK